MTILSMIQRPPVGGSFAELAHFYNRLPHQVDECNMVLRDAAGQQPGPDCYRIDNYEYWIREQYIEWRHVAETVRFDRMVRQYTVDVHEIDAYQPIKDMIARMGRQDGPQPQPQDSSDESLCRGLVDQSLEDHTDDWSFAVASTAYLAMMKLISGRPEIDEPQSDHDGPGVERFLKSIADRQEKLQAALNRERALFARSLLKDGQTDAAALILDQLIDNMEQIDD